MNTKVETLQDNQVKISIDFDAKEVNLRIKQAYRDFAERYNFPGFRRGKAPRPVIDNAMGTDTVRASLTEDWVNEAYAEALDANNLVSLFKPEFDFGDEEIVKDGTPFDFTVTIDVKPEYELSSYDNVSVEIPSTDATEAEIDAQVEELRNYYHDFRDSDDDAVIESGEFVEMTTKVTDDEGNEVPNLSGENRLYELGANLFPAAFDAELIGLKKGDEKSFDIDFTDDTSLLATTLGEGQGLLHFEVKIDTVKEKVLPELTDEWVKLSFGFDGIEDMRKQVAKSIKDQKEASKDRRIENECLAAIASRIEGDMPENMCEMSEVNLLQSFYEQLSRMGWTLDHYLDSTGITADQFKNDMKKQAQDSVRQDMALDAWARHYNIEATDEEISAEFTKANVDDPKAVEAEWKVSGRIPVIREGVVRSKAIADIVEKATVTEAEPSENETQASEKDKAQDEQSDSSKQETKSEKSPEKENIEKEEESAAE